MSIAVRMKWEPVRELGFLMTGAGYSPVGIPVSHPLRGFIFQNFLDTAVMVSFDGVNDHIPMVPNGYINEDIAANKTIQNGFYLPEGQQIYIKHVGVAPVSGSFWFSAMYGADI